MKEFLHLSQIIIAIVLMTLILLQAKGVGLGRAWGGTGEFYKSKRGMEKIIFNVTIMLTFVFLASSMLLLLFS